MTSERACCWHKLKDTVMKRIKLRQILAMIAAIICMLSVRTSWGQTVLVEWNFPDGPLPEPDMLADGGIAANSNAQLTAGEYLGNTNFAGGNSTEAPYIIGWDSGANSNFWLIEFSTAGYENISLSSVQRSTATGPRDFVLQYRIGAGGWQNPSNNAYTVADNYTEGEFDHFMLPAAVNDEPQVFIRWLSTSLTNVGGGTISSTGRNYIDDIVVRGAFIPPPAPDAPILLSAKDPSVSQFTAEWLPVDGAVSYQLDVATSANFTPSGSSGTVVITEIMYDPVAVSDFDGEWFEVYNNGNVPIDINGWEIWNDAANEHTIVNGGPLMVPAYGFLVLADETPASTNGGVVADYDYSGITLSNSGDTLALRNLLGGEVDSVDYGASAFPNASGASLSLIDASRDNLVGTNWIESSSFTYGDGDYGTPGEPNEGGGNWPTPESMGGYLAGYDSLSVTGTSAMVLGLMEGETYYVRVRAFDGFTASSNSAVRSVVADYPPGFLMYLH